MDISGRPGEQPCTIKPCVNLLSDRTIWQYGVKLEMKFHRVSCRRVRLAESVGQTAIDRISRDEKSGRRMVTSNTVIKLPGSLT